MRFSLLLLVLSASAHAAAPMAGLKECSADWRAKRQGGCWARTKAFAGGEQWAWVHPRGWTVDSRCLQDARFKTGEVAAALEAAWKKLDPGTPLGRGGCLSHFNPAWGRALAAAVWDHEMHLACPSHDPASNTCASHMAYHGNVRMLSLGNVERCLGAGGSGLAGVVFHETLHGADADNFSTEKHNAAWELPQYQWIYDAVYGAEAVCFFGADPGQRRFVNIVQCRGVVGRGVSEPSRELCRDFAASFTDQRPMGFIKH